MVRYQQPCCLLGTKSPLPRNHTWDGDPRASLQLRATAPVGSGTPAPRPSPVPLRRGGVEEGEVRDLRCPLHSRHTAVETEAGRLMIHRVCLMLRCGARTLTRRGPPPAEHRRPPRPGPARTDRVSQRKSPGPRPAHTHRRRRRLRLPPPAAPRRGRLGRQRRRLFHPRGARRRLPRANGPAS